MNILLGKTYPVVFHGQSGAAAGPDDLDSDPALMGCLPLPHGGNRVDRVLQQFP
ncbi:hypothetical protein D1872_352370 [compost metagenome]